MKAIIGFLTILLTLTWVGGDLAVGSTRGRGIDAQQIQTLVNNLVQAYNAKDEAAMQQLWAEDGDLVSVPGNVVSKGQRAILEEIKNSRNVHYKDGKLNLTVTSIKFVGKNAAFVEARNMLSGVVTPGGTQLPPIAHHMVLLVEKEKKAWLLDAVRWYSAVPIVRKRS